MRLTVLFCSERELTNKTVPSSPSSDTKVVNLLELQRLHHKLSAEALTNKLDRSKGLLVWLPANFCPLFKTLRSGFKIFVSSIYQFHFNENRVASFRFSRSHWQSSLSTLTTLESDLVTVCKVLNEYLAEKLLFFKEKKSLHIHLFTQASDLCYLFFCIWGEDLLRDKVEKTKQTMPFLLKRWSFWHENVAPIRKRYNLWDGLLMKNTLEV